MIGMVSAPALAWVALLASLPLAGLPVRLDQTVHRHGLPQHAIRLVMDSPEQGRTDPQRPSPRPEESAARGQEEARHRPPGASPLPAEGGKLVRIGSRKELSRARREITRVVFGSDKVPARTYPRRVREVKVRPVVRYYPGRLPVRSIEELVHVMDRGFRAKMHHYRGEGEARSAVIWHRGHGGAFLTSSDPIGPLLQSGHDVIVLDMPLVGLNSDVVVSGRGSDRIFMRSHGQMQALPRPLRYFMEPIAAAVNYALRKERYESVSLAGFSGGAWSVTLYAAMDPRIKRTVAIAGTMPAEFLRRTRGRREKPPGDMEQRYGPLLEAATYPEIWVLGSAGRGRRQLQVQVLDDLATRFGAKEESCAAAAEEIEDKTRRSLQLIGPGEFELHVDKTVTGHRISSQVLGRLLEEVAPSRGRKKRRSGPRPAREQKGGRGRIIP